MGACYHDTKARFKCDLMGHMIKNCPTLCSEQVVKPEYPKQKSKVQGCVYTITEQIVEASKCMITSTFLLFSHDARILIDPGSTHSLIACNFVKCAKFVPESFDYMSSVSTPLDKTMVDELICKSCVLMVRS